LPHPQELNALPVREFQIDELSKKNNNNVTNSLNNNNFSNDPHLHNEATNLHNSLPPADP